LDSTQVVVAPTEPFAAIVRSITIRSGSAAQAASRYSKLKAWCISSGRT
jgi:hypothetical protein